MRSSKISRNHGRRLAMVSSAGAPTAEIGRYTYPKGSKVVNSRHFYQNTVLIDWASRQPRPISLRQLAFFGRRLTPERIISSANFVRHELPVRLAHRIRDMQKLPFAVMSNQHMGRVYEMYYVAFDKLRKTPLISEMSENDQFCDMLRGLLSAHRVIIPQLALGIIETSHEESMHLDPSIRLDPFVSSMLSSRISRRVIAEQHISLTESLLTGKNQYDSDPEFIGEVFLQCSVEKTVRKCHEHAKKLIQQLYPNERMPQIKLEGDLDVALPYIPAHLEYVIGEVLRNSVEATVQHNRNSEEMPDILISVSNTPQSVYIRISDRGGGVSKDILPYIWSFAKSGSPSRKADTLKKIPQLQGLLDEVNVVDKNSSLRSLSIRPPDMKLGMGLALSRVYAEYWDGELQLHSLEGYGCDVSLKISRLGNNSEKLQLDHV